MSDAFVALDRKWPCTYVKRAAEQIVRLSREQMPGGYHLILLPAQLAARGSPDRTLTTSRYLSGRNAPASGPQGKR
jgi:hypothetical protein